MDLRKDRQPLRRARNQGNKILFGTQLPTSSTVSYQVPTLQQTSSEYLLILDYSKTNKYILYAKNATEFNRLLSTVPVSIPRPNILMHNVVILNEALTPLLVMFGNNKLHIRDAIFEDTSVMLAALSSGISLLYNQLQDRILALKDEGVRINVAKEHIPEIVEEFVEAVTEENNALLNPND